MKQAAIYYRDLKAGVLTEDANGYTFVYDKEYLKFENAKAISPTLPLTENPFQSNKTYVFH